MNRSAVKIVAKQLGVIRSYGGGGGGDGGAYEGARGYEEPPPQAPEPPQMQQQPAMAAAPPYGYAPQPQQPAMQPAGMHAHAGMEPQAAPWEQPGLSPPTAPANEIEEQWLSVIRESNLWWDNREVRGQRGRPREGLCGREEGVWA
jgi:hypothetical protein